MTLANTIEHVAVLRGCPAGSTWAGGAAPSHVASSYSGSVDAVTAEAIACAHGMLWGLGTLIVNNGRLGAHVDSFEATGWLGAGGKTLGLRFGGEKAREFVDPSWTEVTILLDGEPHAFPIRAAFWRHCPEVRGAAITAWFRRHGLAPWPRGSPPRVKLTALGPGQFRAHLPPR